MTITNTQPSPAATAPSTWWDRLYEAENTDTHDAVPPVAEPAGEGSDGPPETPAEGEAQPEDAVGTWWSKLTRQAVADPRVEPEQVPPVPAVAVPGQPFPVPVPRMDRKRRARWAWALYNTTAGLCGWGTGLLALEQSWLSTGQSNPAGMASLILTVGAGSATWRLCGRITGIPYRAAIRTGAALTAASLADQSGATAVHALANIGLAPTLIVPIATGLTISALTWHLIDRRTRTWWAPLAWTLRIPLATAALALALYPTR